MSNALYVATEFTSRHGFTEGIEGPACDRAGNIYAVNFARQGTIGKVTPAGKCGVFVTLPNGSIGNGIRFTSTGDMLITAYINHDVLKVATRTGRGPGRRAAYVREHTLVTWDWP